MAEPIHIGAAADVPEGEAIVAELRDDWLRLTDSMTRLGKDPS